MPVPGVQDVHEFSRSIAFLVDAGRKKIDFAGVNVFVKQIHGDRIIDVVTDVGLHDKVDGTGLASGGSPIPATCQAGRKDSYKDEYSFHDHRNLLKFFPVGHGNLGTSLLDS